MSLITRRGKKTCSSSYNRGKKGGVPKGGKFRTKGKLEPTARANPHSGSGLSGRVDLLNRGKKGLDKETVWLRRRARIRLEGGGFDGRKSAKWNSLLGAIEYRKKSGAILLVLKVRERGSRRKNRRASVSVFNREGVAKKINKNYLICRLIGSKGARHESAKAVIGETLSKAGWRMTQKKGGDVAPW